MEQLPAIDWRQAVAVGTAALAVGPRLSRDEVAEVVAALRTAADASVGHVAEVTELARPAAAPMLVVDRVGWLQAGVQSAEALLASVEGATPTPRGRYLRLKARALGAEAGLVFGVIATRILGQFDPFYQPNRLLLVAPNVVAVERRLGALPADFRLWVCLHEQTHRFQFGHAPWLRSHLIGLVTDMLDSDDFGIAFTPRRSGREAEPQQQAFGRITAVMSLLEGHADVMMDRVGESVVPSYASIRRAFDHRRAASGWSGAFQKLLGLDLKYAQYREGAQFCRAVITAAGVGTLNQAFATAEALPSLPELRDPQRWLRRV
jgi:uncharacterized protein (DUF2342 family)